MVESTRDRAKRLFPAVSLTLLSIVQAIALELLWSHTLDAQYLYLFSWELPFSFIGWIQITATLIAIGLVWVVYASNIMRFQWVPSMADLCYPFIIGIAEFWLVSTLQPTSMGWWFIATALNIGLVTAISQFSMRSARLDPDNDEFFATRSPATLADFIPQISIVLLFLALGIAVMIVPQAFWLRFIGGSAVLVFLFWQIFSSARYWRDSMREKKA